MATRSHHVADSGAERGPNEARSLARGWGVLRIIGFVGVASGLIVRSVEFALVGVWLGIDDLVNVLRLFGAFGTQLFGVFGVIQAGALARAVLAGRPRGMVRTLVVSSTLVVVVSVAIASGALSEVVRLILGERLVSRLPVESSLVLAATVAMLSAAVGIEALAEPRRRAPGIVLLAASVVAFSQSGRAMIQQFASAEFRGMELVTGALAALEWFVAGAVSVFAMAWLGSRKGRGADLSSFARIRGAALVLGAMAGACGGTFLAVSGQRPGAGPWALFLSRLVELALDPFSPYVPFALRSYAELLRIAVAGLAFVLCPRESRLCVSIGFSLFGCLAAGTPAGGLALMLGATVLALDESAAEPASGGAPTSGELPRT